MGAMSVMGLRETMSESGPRDTPGVVSFSWHARKRGARRNVAPDAVEYVLAYGRSLQRTGVTFFFLGRRDIPPCDRCAGWASRLEGTIVIVAPDGDIITVYRDRRGLRLIARKMKYRLYEHVPRVKDNEDGDEAQAPATERATA